MIECLRVRRWILVVCVLVAACTTSERGLLLLEGAGQVYPQQALEQGIEGWVEVGYDVNVSGQVERARVVRSEPAEIFDEAALQAVRSWRFAPPLRQGIAQPVSDLRSTLTFRLSGGVDYSAY